MTPPPPGAARAPRDVITEDALFVSPSLIGLPLARPWRRAVAMLIDVTLVTMLAQAPSVLFAVAVALVLFRVSARRAVDGGYFRRSTRLVLRFWGALVLFVFALRGWDSASERVGAMLADGTGAASLPEKRGEKGTESPLSLDGMDGIRGAADLIAFRQADDPAEARRRGERAVRTLGKGGLKSGDVHEALSEIAASTPDRPWLAAVADSIVRETGGPKGSRDLDADSLLSAYAAAFSAGDRSGAERLRPTLAAELARDTMRQMQEEIADLRAERAKLQGAVDALEEEAEERGFLSMVRGLAEDLGLGFGWTGLYFTATLALWQGRTPGKRLLGIRVIRLNGKQIGWWGAFERFGGYAAGIATGLLGFFQILWDRNRQAIHDKITETAVIRDL